MHTNSHRTRRIHIDAAIVSAMLLTTQISPAHAYVDPGSISMVVTAILGGIAAIGYSARMYFAKVRSFFTRDKPVK